MIETDIRIACSLKEFRTSNLKTTKIKITSLNLYLYFVWIFENLGRIIDALTSLKIIDFLKTCPSGIDHNKPFQNTAIDYPKLRHNGAITIFHIVEQMLNGNKIIPGNNSLVMIIVPTVRTAIDVTSLLMTAVADSIGLTSEDIATVPFIAKNLNNCARCPLGSVALV